MHPRRRFPLPLIWLNWVAANAASLGVIGSAIDSLRLLLGAEGLPHEVGGTLTLIIVLVGTGFWAWTQQVILQGSGFYVRGWILSTYVGFVFAALGSWIFMLFAGLAIFTLLPGQIALLVFVAGFLFTFGGIVAAVQTSVMAGSIVQHRCWIFASGLGLLGAVTSGSMLAQPVSAHMVLAMVGIAYGSITGCCLVWLVKNPLPPAHPRLPYFARDEALKHQKWRGLPRGFDP
jgi:hypothetical protein